MRYVCLLALTFPFLWTIDRPAASIAPSDARMPRRAEGLGPADFLALIGYTAAASGADAEAVAAFADSCKVDQGLPEAGMSCRRWKFQTSFGPCRITAATLAGEPEGWGIAANVFCGSSHGLAGYFISRTMPRATGGRSVIHG